MKLTIKILLSFLFFSNSFIAQISFNSAHVGAPRSLKAEIIADFKKTETVFLLSKVYEKEVYEKILDDSWQVTPYQVVDIENFKMTDYLNGNFSFAMLGNLKKESDIKTSYYVYLDIFMYDMERIKKKMDKNKDIQDLLKSNKIDIARMYFSKTGKFNKFIQSNSVDKTFVKMYTEEVFYNYKPGFLTNYFRKVSDLITAGEKYWMYKLESLPEIKKLKKEKLYVPAYIANLLVFTEDDEDVDTKVLTELFKSYKYEYEVIDDDVLDNMIVKGEEVYYLSYVDMNGEQFVSIINSKTGERIYRWYKSSISSGLGPKNIRDLNNSIDD